MVPYRLLSYFADTGEPRAGLLIGDLVYDLDALTRAAGRDHGLQWSTMLDILRDWEATRPILEIIAADPPPVAGWPLAATRLMAPILYPGALYCAAANYSDHLEEMTGKAPDKSTLAPYFFLKTPVQSVIGPGAEIRLPTRHTGKVDWEAEIGVVIGRAARNVPAARAMDHVAGYVVVNDLSARDHMRRDDWPFRSDWFGQKCWDTSAPMGPWITPAAAIADPHALAIRTWVNEALRQDSSSRRMIFDIPEQIAAISRQLTLRPGDVIATGTCAGVGHARGTYLGPGDRVRIEIEGLGTLENPVVAGL
ncbi:MAG: fumarylacetoacetate hydrolase family protein [Alphaproteobacteria bacterium]|nr:fumarylacetoacetate hydrolase family protein [Alphaproteobacteria bacterium]